MIRDTSIKSLEVYSISKTMRHATRPRARFVLDTDALDWIYPMALRQKIMQLVDMPDEPVTAMQVEADPSLLADVQLLFSGWRAPRFTNDMIEVAPNLEAIFYGAGTTGYFMCDAIRQRRIQVTSAIDSNSKPVAEYTVAQITLCLKRVWQLAHAYKTTRSWSQLPDGASGYGSTVGLVSLGRIGRMVAEQLSKMDMKVIAYDIHEDESMCQMYGIEYVSLQELFIQSDVVSIHTPCTRQTCGMITAELLNTMKHGGSLINTSRGELLDHHACNQVWAQRPDLMAILDVTDPEPLPADSILWTLPNVMITPHIAGSRGRECERMGRAMLMELNRYLLGQPLQYRVDL